ncbi:hypothetical protein SISSUDRAFT_1065250 [Sistotremastrum suecicum HHB10207 ss-3]|uniref:Uncharacterized protein n=1 Tax=Sistotremastrum suecicum HHB10207 ss-3 TaxID=1314776 RepID=A0A165ZQA4_9AGAM|nr:hypothetical protein SISSUDRAFT_1065250 [Sistotremastrum suecicum HHB10207 ss-3]
MPKAVDPNRPERGGPYPKSVLTLAIPKNTISSHQAFTKNVVTNTASSETGSLAPLDTVSTSDVSPFTPAAANTSTTCAENTVTNTTLNETNPSILLDTASHPVIAPLTPTTEPIPSIELGDAPPPPPAPFNPPHNPPPQQIRPLRLWGYINYVPDVACIPLGPLTPTEVDDEDLADMLANLPFIDGEPEPEVGDDGGQEMRVTEAEQNAHTLGTAPVATLPPPPPVAAPPPRRPQFLPAPPHLAGLTGEQMHRVAVENNYAFYSLEKR